MDHLQLLAIGTAFGVAGTAGVGPVNVMTIQRVLRHGFWSGIFVAAGAILADLLFATAAALGLGAVTGYIDRHLLWIQLGGAGLVIAFGVHSLMAHPTMRPSRETSRKRASGAATAFAMKLANPGTLLVFVALFVALGDLVPESGERVRVAEIVLGVAIGSLLWWTILALTVSQVRVRVTEGTLELISRVAGSLLIGLGAVILARATLLGLRQL